MKRLLVAFLCFGSGACAMTGDGAASATDNQIVARLKAPDANGTEQVVEFAYAQAMRLRYFEWCFQIASDENKSDVERECAVDMIREFQTGKSVWLSAPWYASEILELVRRATVEVFTEPNVHEFVRTLHGNQACLLFPALAHFGFDGSLLAVIENDIAWRLFCDAPFFVQSLAPVHFEDAWTGLPARACSVFIAESKLMFKDLLPVYALRPELIKDQRIPGEFVAASEDGGYVCVRVDGQLLAVYNTQTMQQAGKPVPGDKAEFSSDGRLLRIDEMRDDYSRWRSIYTTETMQRVKEGLRNDVGFSPDGRFLWAAGWAYADGAWINIYTTENMQWVKKARGKKAGFSLDGRLLWAMDSHDDQDWISVYTTETMQLVKEVPGWLAGFSLDGRRLWVMDSHDDSRWIGIYATETMHLVKEVQGQDVAFSADGQFVLVSDVPVACTWTTVYKTENMQMVNKMRGEGCRLSSDGRLLWGRGWHDGRYWITLYTVENMQRVKEVQGDRVELSSDGHVVRIEDGNTAKFYAASDMRELTHFEGKNRIAKLFEPTASALAIAQEEGDCYANSFAHVISPVCENNSAQHLAALAAIHRQQASGEVAAKLDLFLASLSGKLRNASEALQMFCQDKRA